MDTHKVYLFVRDMDGTYTLFGVFTKEEIAYMDRFPDDPFDRRDVLIDIRENTKLADVPARFLVDDQAQDPFFPVYEDLHEIDYGRETEDYWDWWEEVDDKTDLNGLKIKISRAW
jgi:hypothetical protein